MYGIVNVNRKDVATFMNEVIPSSASIDLSDETWVGFEFESYFDFTKAQKWVYSHYDFDIMGDDKKVIGAVYYDKNVGYCFVCDEDGHEEQGFSRPDKAECALLDYYYQNEVA
jgi:hypothetical protein